MQVLPRYINYGNMLYETLRNYYSVNNAGEMTWLYKFCAACIGTMQAPFNTYFYARQQNCFIVQGTWQMGQLTQILNYLYDPLFYRIYITQSKSLAPGLPVFGYVTGVHSPEFGGDSPDAFRAFGDAPDYSILTIHVPADLGLLLSYLTATVAQMALAGIQYQIVTF